MSVELDVFDPEIRAQLEQHAHLREFHLRRNYPPFWRINFNRLVAPRTTRAIERGHELRRRVAAAIEVLRTGSCDRE